MAQWKMRSHTQTQTQTCTGLYGGRQVSSLRDIVRTNRNQRLLSPRLRKLGRGGDPGAESGDQSWSNARGAGRRAPVIVILAGGDERRGRGAVRGRRRRARQQLVGPGAVRGREGLKQLQFVLPTVKKLPLQHLVGAGRGQGERRPALVRLAVQSKLSVECEAMTMRRQAILSTRSHGV